MVHLSFVPILIHSRSVFTQDIIIVLQSRKIFVIFIFCKEFLKKKFFCCSGVLVRDEKLQKSDDIRRREKESLSKHKKQKSFSGIPKSFYCLSKYYTKRNKWFVHGEFLEKDESCAKREKKFYLSSWNLKWRVKREESFMRKIVIKNQLKEISSPLIKKTEKILLWPARRQFLKYYRKVPFMRVLVCAK